MAKQVYPTLSLKKYNQNRALLECFLLSLLFLKIDVFSVSSYGILSHKEERNQPFCLSGLVGQVMLPTFLMIIAFKLSNIQ